MGKQALSRLLQGNHSAPPSRGAGLGRSHLTQSGRFKAMLWMCEEFPLSLVEQVVPIIDLMARTSAHFARLRDFIKLEFPPGFPIKIGTFSQAEEHPTRDLTGKGRLASSSV